MSCPHGRFAIEPLDPPVPGLAMACCLECGHRWELEETTADDPEAAWITGESRDTKNFGRPWP